MRRLGRRLGLAHLAVGAVISLTENLWGAVAGGPTVFAWSGSLAGNLTLLWWWLILPALTWPVDLFWTLYHAAGPA